MDTAEGTFNRMKGFTALSTSKNPIEYTRKYVDETFETTDVVGMSTSMDWTMDQLKDDPVHDKIVDIIDSEKIGDDAVVTLLTVDFTQEGTTAGTFKEKKRTFTLIPGTEGDGAEAYTYSGTFRVKSEKVDGEVTSIDNFKTSCTFTASIPEG